MTDTSSTITSSLMESPLYPVVAAQLIGTLVASLLCLALDRVAALSALLAGMSSLIPALYVVLVSLKPVSSGGDGLKQAIKGELGKFALTIALLAVIFVFVEPLNVMVFFGTFILMQLLHAIVPVFSARRLLKR